MRQVGCSDTEARSSSMSQSYYWDGVRTYSRGMSWMMALVSLLIFICSGYRLLMLFLSEPLFPSSSEKVYVLLIALMLSSALLFPIGKKQINWYASVVLLTFAAITCAIGIILPPQRGDAAVLTAWSAQLFFLSRPLSIAAGMLAMVFAFASAKDAVNRRILGANAHWWALVASTLFLGGEIMGSYWSFVGWGRSWSWSAHFYFSALTYLLWILVFHIPRHWARDEQQLKWFQGSILLVTILLNLGYRIW